MQTQAARLAGVVEAVMARESAATLEEPGGITYEQAVTQLVHAMFQLTTPPPSGEAPTVSQLPDVSKPEGLSQLVWHFVRVESLNFEIFTACNLANERIGTMQKELKTLRVRMLSTPPLAVRCRVHTLLCASRYATNPDPFGSGNRLLCVTCAAGRDCAS